MMWFVGVMCVGSLMWLRRFQRLVPPRWPPSARGSRATFFFLTILLSCAPSTFCRVIPSLFLFGRRNRAKYGTHFALRGLRFLLSLDPSKWTGEENGRMTYGLIYARIVISGCNSEVWALIHGFWSVVMALLEAFIID